MNIKPICAITGSNGYVGGCLKKYFERQGWAVLELVRQPKRGGGSAAFHLGKELDPGVLCGVQVMIHCAYDFRPLHWAEIVAVNIDGSKKLFRAAREAGVNKIICLSTISAFSGCRSLYGKAKLDIEKIALGNGALVIRPGLVYGDDAGGMFGKLVSQVRRSSWIPIIGDGSQIQFLVHNENLSSYIENIASGKIELVPQILTAANPEPWKLKQLVREIAKGMRKKPGFIPMPWRLVWLLLKMLEISGLRLAFRSDSLVSLMYQNPAPDFSKNTNAGLICHPLEIGKLKL